MNNLIFIFEIIGILLMIGLIFWSSIRFATSISIKAGLFVLTIFLCASFFIIPSYNNLNKRFQVISSDKSYVPCKDVSSNDAQEKLNTYFSGFSAFSNLASGSFAFLSLLVAAMTLVYTLEYYDFDKKKRLENDAKNGVLDLQEKLSKSIDEQSIEIDGKQFNGIEALYRSAVQFHCTFHQGRNYSQKPFDLSFDWFPNSQIVRLFSEIHTKIKIHQISSINSSEASKTVVAIAFSSYPFDTILRYSSKISETFNQATIKEIHDANGFDGNEDYHEITLIFAAKIKEIQTIIEMMRKQ